MKKLILIAATAALTIGAQAQKGGLKVTAGLSPILPIGDMADGYSFGAGLFVKADYGLTKELALTGSLGYDYFFGKSTTIDLGIFGSTTVSIPNTGVIPILVGGTYNMDKLFVNLNAGYTIPTESNADGNFTVSPRVGYYVSDKVSVDLGYNHLFYDGGSTQYLNARIGYSF